MPDLKVMRSQMYDPKICGLNWSETLTLLAYAEKLEAVAQLVVDDRIQEYDEPMRDALLAAGWEV